MSKRDAALITLIYALWLIAAYLINVLATGARTPQELLDGWVRFDGIYFRVIAENGYAEGSRIIRWQQGFPFLTAAFPLFPLLIHVVTPVLGGDYSLASVVVPQVLTWLSLLALFGLITLDFPRRVAYGTVLSLMAFPTFYFLLAPYSETIFLLLTILTFYGYRRRQYWASGGLGALAAAARIVGAPLVVGALGIDIAVGAWRRRRRRADLFQVPQYTFLAVVPAGLLVYMLYQWLDFGNPLMFLRGHASSEWRVGFSLLGPIKGVLLPFYTLLERDWTTAAFRSNLFNSAFLYFAIAIAIYAWRKLPLSYSLYAALAIIVPTFTGSLISIPRFLLISFPLFLGMGLLFDEHPRLRWLLVPLALAELLATWLFFKTIFLG